MNTMCTLLIGRHLADQPPQHRVSGRAEGICKDRACVAWYP